MNNSRVCKFLTELQNESFELDVFELINERLISLKIYNWEKEQQNLLWKILSALIFSLQENQFKKFEIQDLLKSLFTFQKEGE